MVIEVLPLKGSYSHEQQFERRHTKNNRDIAESGDSLVWDANISSFRRLESRYSWHRGFTHSLLPPKSSTMPAISFLPFLQTVPFATRILTLTLLLFTISALFHSLLAGQNSPAPPLPGQDMPWLVMIPGQSYRYPWTLLTAGWVELSVFEVRSLKWSRMRTDGSSWFSR